MKLKGKEVKKAERPPIMKCGHTANAKTKGGAPCCVICLGISDGASEIDESFHEHALQGRKAKCDTCGKSKVESRLDLPFFEHKPTKDHDKYYCGCFGWD